MTDLEVKTFCKVFGISKQEFEDQGIYINELFENTMKKEGLLVAPEQIRQIRRESEKRTGYFFKRKKS